MLNKEADRMVESYHNTWCSLKASSIAPLSVHKRCSALIDNTLYLHLSLHLVQSQIHMASVSDSLHNKLVKALPWQPSACTRESLQNYKQKLKSHSLIESIMILLSTLFRNVFLCSSVCFRERDGQQASFE